MVSSATSFGIFVTLDAMYVEGLVHITELGGEYFKFDEARQELRGERTGIRYAIGTRVRVQVSRVDLDGRKIDFRLVREGEALVAPRPARERGAGGGAALRVPQDDGAGLDASQPPARSRRGAKSRSESSPERSAGKGPAGGAGKAAGKKSPGKSASKSRRTRR